MTSDTWIMRACGLLAALGIASVDELARVTDLRPADISLAAQLFEGDMPALDPLTCCEENSTDNSLT